MSSSRVAGDDIVEEAVWEEQFILYTHQVGPIATVPKLLDLLSLKCDDKLTSRLDILDQSAIWSEGEGPLTVTKFVKMMREIRIHQASNQPRFIPRDECTALFYALSDGSEFLATSVARAVSGAFQSEAFETFALEYVSVDTFTNIVSEDAELSRRLAKMQTVVKAAATYVFTGEHDLEMEELVLNSLPSEEESRIIERWELVTVDNLITVIRQVQADLQREAAEKERLHLEKFFNQKQGGKRRAYFSPSDVVPTTGTSIGTADVSGIAVQASQPAVALDSFDGHITAQSLVSRVAELRRLQKSQERDSVLLEREAVLSATHILRDEDVRRQEEMDFSDVKFGNIGDSASSRLFPHHQTPHDSIVSRMRMKLGLEYLRHETSENRTASQYVPRGVKKQFIPKKYPPKPRNAGREAADFFRDTSSRKVEPNFDTTMPVRPVCVVRSRRRNPRPAASAVDMNNSSWHEPTKHMSCSDALHDVSILIADARKKTRKARR